MIARPLILAAALVTMGVPPALAGQIQTLSPSILLVGSEDEAIRPDPVPARTGYVPHLPLPPGMERPAPRPKIVSNPPTAADRSAAEHTETAEHGPGGE